MSEQCPHIVGMSWCEQCAEERIAELEAELTLMSRNGQELYKLREAAQAVVDMSHERAALPGAFKGEIDALAALLKESGE